MKKIFTIVALIVVVISCKKEATDRNTALKKLFDQYKDGEIDEANYNGETVYVSSLNAYDAGTSIHDQNGNVIGGCNFAYNLLDPICAHLTETKVVYRCKNHISGQPPVDLYQLSSK